MKKILYIFLTLSILSTGCSKEDDVQLTQETFFLGRGKSTIFEPKVLIFVKFYTAKSTILESKFSIFVKFYTGKSTFF